MDTHRRISTGMRLSQRGRKDDVMAKTIKELVLDETIKYAKTQKDKASAERLAASLKASSELARRLKEMAK